MPSLLRPPRLSLLLLLLLIVVWGTNWITLKLALEYVPPIWSVFFRTFPACLIFWTVCSISGRARIPVKADVPIILSVGVLHMVVFSVIVSMGMQYLPAGRSIVVAYTTPLWVLPAAWLFLREPISLRQLLGLLSGLSGLILLLSPWAVNWGDHDILLGYGLVLLGSFFWAISIVYGRAHVWTTPLFELLPWQLLIASLSELLIALAVEGLPDIAWSVDLILYIGYSSLVGTALGYWLMSTVNRDFPASFISMALLGVPVVGLLCSNLALGEHFDLPLIIATIMIISGIALGTARQAKG